MVNTKNALLRIITVATLLTGSFGPIASASGFTFKAGVGYDFLSQEFFLDSAALTGPDSLLTQWELTTDYYDDLKGQLSFSYIPHDDRRLELSATYDQTRDFLRARLNGNIRADIKKSRLDLTAEIEGKNRYRGEDEFGQSYLLAYGRGKLTTPLTNSLNLAMQIHADGVSFESTSEYNYNYYRYGGRLGLEKSFDNFSFAEITLYAENRLVPDSGDLDYSRIGVESSFMGFYGASGQLDLLGTLEKKDYNRPNNQYDHYRLDLDGRNRVSLSGQWLSQQELTFEMTQYDPDDPVSNDYSLTRLALLAGLERIRWTILAGPEFRLMDEQVREGLTFEDYSEYAGRINLDYVDPSLLWLSVESSLGRRNQDEEEEFHSDFTFERLTVFGELTLATGLSLNALFSAEWEWHEVSTDDTRIYLLSSSLTYSF